MYVCSSGVSLSMYVRTGASLAKRVCMSETLNYPPEGWVRFITKNVQYLTFNSIFRDLWGGGTFGGHQDALLDGSVEGCACHCVCMLQVRKWIDFPQHTYWKTHFLMFFMYVCSEACNCVCMFRGMQLCMYVQRHATVYVCSNIHTYIHAYSGAFSRTYILSDTPFEHTYILTYTFRTYIHSDLPVEHTYTVTYLEN